MPILQPQVGRSMRIACTGVCQDWQIHGTIYWQHIWRICRSSGYKCFLHLFGLVTHHSLLILFEIFSTSMGWSHGSSSDSELNLIHLETRHIAWSPVFKQFLQSSSLTLLLLEDFQFIQLPSPTRVRWEISSVSKAATVISQIQCVYTTDCF